MFPSRQVGQFQASHHSVTRAVPFLGNSEWVTQSEGAVQFKSVTSCAGMTTHFVLLAQTKVGFLSGGWSRRMKELPEKEVLAQLEKSYARATVALTRVQKLCIIMGLLDMRELLGAATIIGCLKYGAGVCGVHVNNPSAEVPGRPHLSGARFISFSRTQFWWPWNAFLCRVAVI